MPRGFRNSSSSISPGCVGGRWRGRRRSTRGAFCRGLVVVGDFDFVCIVVLPAETNPVLIVDADAVLTGAISLQALQPVPGRHGELGKLADPVDLRQLPPCHRPQARWTYGARLLAAYAVKHILGALIGEGAYHGPYYNGRRNISPNSAPPYPRQPHPRRRPFPQHLAAEHEQLRRAPAGLGVLAAGAFDQAGVLDQAPAGLPVETLAGQGLEHPLQLQQWEGGGRAPRDCRPVLE